MIYDWRMALGLGFGACAGFCVLRRASLLNQMRRRYATSVITTHAGPTAYQQPDWVPSSVSPPSSRVRLAALPTPLHDWELPGVDRAQSQLWIKRDDISGCELSGNKVRKLEFLLAEALSQGCDSVITVGGIQSNHCRATAAAARRLGLEPHIILRTDRPDADPGLTGNLLIDRIVGANIHLVGEEEFARKGGWQLVCELKERLATRHGKAPYCFPSGGSNSLGTWGYIEAVRELKAQLEASGEAVDRIYFACGSGGTAAGLALGVHWSGLGASGTELVGLGVDDTPTFFYDKLDQIFEGLGVPRSADGAPMSSRALLRLEQCIGAGYAQSTDAELAAIVQIARSTGIVLDPVYSGKAAIGLAADLKARPVKRALFIHTGGLLGLYAKEEQLAPLLAGGWSSFS